MSSPTTKAGKALHDWLGWHPADGRDEYIIAVEAEARAEHPNDEVPDGEWFWVSGRGPFRIEFLGDPMHPEWRIESYDGAEGPWVEYRPTDDPVAEATAERLERALAALRGKAREWTHMEFIADHLASSEGADTPASQDADEAARQRRRELAAAIAAELRDEA